MIAALFHRLIRLLIDYDQLDAYIDRLGDELQ